MQRNKQSLDLLSRNLANLLKEPGKLANILYIGTGNFHQFGRKQPPKTHLSSAQLTFAATGLLVFELRAEVEGRATLEGDGWVPWRPVGPVAEHWAAERSGRASASGKTELLGSLTPGFRCQLRWLTSGVNVL